MFLYICRNSPPPPTLGTLGGERNCSYHKRACYLQQFSSTQGLINPARPPVILRRVRNNDGIIVFFLLCNWDISGCCGSIATLAHGAAGHWTFVEPTTPYTALLISNCTRKGNYYAAHRRGLLRGLYMPRGDHDCKPIATPVHYSSIWCSSPLRGS